MPNCVTVAFVLSRNFGLRLNICEQKQKNALGGIEKIAQIDTENGEMRKKCGSTYIHFEWQISTISMFGWYF